MRLLKFGLPLTKPLLAVATETAYTERPVRDRRKVLVTDDNEDAANALSMLVEELGGSSRTAYNATIGLQVVKDFQPDTVLLDIGMPKIDGYETCRQLRQEPSLKNIIIVAVSGWGQSQDKQRALDAGFDAHLTKPVDPKALAHVLAGNTRRPSP